MPNFTSDKIPSTSVKSIVSAGVICPAKPVRYSNVSVSVIAAPDTPLTSPIQRTRKMEILELDLREGIAEIEYVFIIGIVPQRAIITL